MTDPKAVQAALTRLDDREWFGPDHPAVILATAYRDLTQRHAAEVEQAYREGYAASLGKADPVYDESDTKWLASDTRKGLR